MKKIILTAAAVFAISFANAQEAKSFGFAKGDFTIGGNIKSISSDGSSYTELTPSVGYFVSDKVSINASLSSVSGDTATDPDTGDTVSLESTTSFGVGARYYMLDLGERFKVYSGAGLSFGKDLTVLNAGIGVNYFLTQKLSINWGLASLITYSKSGDVSATVINLNEYRNFLNDSSFGLTYKF